MRLAVFLSAEGIWAGKSNLTSHIICSAVQLASLGFWLVWRRTTPKLMFLVHAASDRNPRWTSRRCLASPWRRTTGRRRRRLGREPWGSPRWAPPWVWAASSPRLRWTLTTRRKWSRTSLRLDSISILTSEPLHTHTSSDAHLYFWLHCSTCCVPWRCTVGTKAWAVCKFYF